MCLIACGTGTWAQAQELPKEQEVRAVILYHLTQFVTWPAASLNQSTEFVIGILGPDPFGAALDEVVKGEKVGNRSIRIMRSNRARDLADSQLVYVSSQVRQPLSRVFEELDESAILTVGDSEDFLTQGGMIRFRRTPERKTRLQVHLTRARQKGFNISAQLLRVSDVVEGGNQ